MSWFYVEGILIQCGYVLMVVLGLSLLTGFTGLFSFGHAGFMAIGAYASVVCTTRLGLPFWLGLIAGGIVAAIIGAGLGRLTLKLKGDYFCIATLGFGEAVKLILDNWDWVGGARGVSNIPWVTDLKTVIIVCVLAVFVLVCLIRSRHGRNMVAIREEELAAEMSGINVFKYKMIALCISAAYAGIGGGLMAHYLTYIQPKMFQMAKSTEYTIMVIFGGMGSVTGSVLGTILLTFLPELLRTFANWRMVIYGLAVILIMISRPSGLMGGKEFSLKGIANFFRKLFKGKEKGGSSKNGKEAQENV